MAGIYVYPGTCTDFTTVGLAGDLHPVSAKFEEQKNGISSLTIVMPYDDLGKWQSCVPGNYVKAKVPVRVPPAIDNDEYMSCVQEAAPKPPAQQPVPRRRFPVYNLANQVIAECTYDAKIVLTDGTAVPIGEGLSEEARKANLEWNERIVRDHIHQQSAQPEYEKRRETGYVKVGTYNETQTVAIPQNFAGLEATATPTRLKYQFFVIVKVTESIDTVTVYCEHVFYEQYDNYTEWNPQGAAAGTRYSGAAACRNVLANIISPDRRFRVASDCSDMLACTELDTARKNVVEAFLNPSTGICAKYGLSLIRDNWDFYCLKNVGYDRGFVVEYGKNMLTVQREEDVSNVITRVIPIGYDADNEVVWLSEKFVDSNYIGNYGAPRSEIYDTGLKIGEGDVTASNIADKMRAAARKRFTEDHIDLPEVKMDVSFLSLGDTEEYAQYRGLDKVYLYDIITVHDTVRGYDYQAQVIGVTHDVLTGMLEKVTIGSIEHWSGVRKIASWQVPEISGNVIRMGTLPGKAIEPGSVLWDHLNSGTKTRIAVESLTAVTVNAQVVRAAILAAGKITADDIEAGSITTATLAAGAVTADKVAANAITAGKIDASAVTTEKLAAGAVTAYVIASGAVTTDKLDAGAVTAGKIAANAITADAIDTQSITAINAKLGIADIASATIASADIGYAQIKDLVAGTAIFDTTITEQGIADRLFINRLLITYGQMVSATIGDLVIGASDGNYYHVDVEWDEDGIPSLVPTQVDTPSAAEIEAGHTTEGKTIIGDVGTYAELSSTDFYAINSIMDVITAKRIDVDELWARQAFIDKLMVQDISSNTYIRSTIGDWRSGSTITQTIDGLDSRISSLGYGTVFMQPDEPDHSVLIAGDIWIQTMAEGTWQTVYDNQTDFPTWQAIYNNVSTWQVLGSVPKMKVWDGVDFQLMYDALLPDILTTEIEQLAEAINLKASRTEVDELTGRVYEFGVILSVQADQINAAVEAVDTKASTYVMWANPRTVYGNSVSLGDIWIKRDESFATTWQNVYNSYETWQNIYDTHDSWGDGVGDRTYVYTGNDNWVLTSDRAEEITLRTEIIETAREITLLAEQSARLNGQLTELSASLTVTAERISQEVSRAMGAENGKLDKTSQYQTADSIVSEAVSQAQVFGDGTTGYIKKTGTYQTAASIVTEAVEEAKAFGNGSNGYIKKTSTYQDADSIRAEAVSDAKDASILRTTTYQTAAQIYNAAVSKAKSNGDNAYVKSSETMKTADSIYNAVTSYVASNYLAAEEGYEDVYDILNEAQTRAQNIANGVGQNVKNLCIAKTQTLQTADAIVNAAVAKWVDDYGTSYIATTSTIHTATDIVNSAKSYTDGQLTSYSTTSQTASQISSYVTSNAYTLKSGIDIKAAGIEISSSKYVKILSGGKLIIESGNFKIDSSGNVEMTGKVTAGSGSKIGGWNLTNTRLYSGADSGSSSTYVALDSGTNNVEYAMWAGKENPDNAPFSVKRNGYLYAKIGSIAGWAISGDTLSCGYAYIGSYAYGGYVLHASNGYGEVNIGYDGAISCASLTMSDGTISRTLNAGIVNDLMSWRITAIERYTEAVGGIRYVKSMQLQNGNTYYFYAPAAS